MSPVLLAFALAQGRRAGTLRPTMALDLSSSPIDRLRLSSLLDGISYLVLVGIAMPLKYLADMPMAVRIVGSLHGGLFILLCCFLLETLLRRKLSFGWCVIVFLCALVPFAPFLLDRKLREKKST